MMLDELRLLMSDQSCIHAISALNHVFRSTKRRNVATVVVGVFSSKSKLAYKNVKLFIKSIRDGTFMLDQCVSFFRFLITNLKKEINTFKKSRSDVTGHL